jgi:hypothetical protein
MRVGIVFGMVWDLNLKMLDQKGYGQMIQTCTHNFGFRFVVDCSFE